MKVIFADGPFKIRWSKSACAIGIFDGVHRGHQYLIGAMCRRARQMKAKAVVVTFFPHPVHVLRSKAHLPYITSLPERLALIKGLGVDAVVVIPFNKTFAKIDPQHFIKDFLVDKIAARSIFIGEDFRFGKNRKGNMFLFDQLASQYGYEIHALPALKDRQEPISSTRIRGAITAGDLAQAKRLLGRYVEVSGCVIKGDGRGRQLGFPTANVAYEADVIPSQGVYAVRACVGKRCFDAVANLGVRPTFKAAHVSLHLEVHLLGVTCNLYGKRMKVQFIQKIRNEKSFANAQALIAQISKDLEKAKRILQ